MMKFTDSKLLKYGDILVALVTGLVLSAFFLGAISPNSFYALALPLLWSTARWGIRGGIGSILFLLVPVWLSLNALSGYHLGGFALLVVAFSVGWLQDGRKQHQRLWMRIPAFEDQLAVALNAVAVWDLVLAETWLAFELTEGAWVWDEPQPAITLQERSSAIETATWRQLVAWGKTERAGWQRRPAWLRELQVRGLRTQAVSLDKWQGTLVLLRAGRRFSQAENDYLTVLLRMARQVVRSQSQYARADMVLKHQIQELETIQHLNRVMGQSLDLDATLQVVLESFRELVFYDIGEITYWDPEREILVRGAMLGSEAGQKYLAQLPGTYELTEGLTGWLAQNRRPLLLDDLQHFAPVRPKIDGPDLPMHSYIGVPLVVRGELIGTLEVGLAEPAGFAEHDLTLLQNLGAQAAIAIDKARLYRVAKRRVHTLERLSTVVQAASRADDLATLFREIVTRVAEIVNAEFAGILLYEPGHERLVAREPFLGLSGAWLQNYVFDLSEPTARSFLEQRDYWMIEDAASEPYLAAWGVLPAIRAANIQQTLLVALRAGGEQIGFIQVAKQREGQCFTGADVRLLTMLTAQLSGMIHISTLLEALEERTRQMESLVSVATTLGVSLDLAAVLEAIVEAAFMMLNCQRTGIFVVGTDNNTLNLAAARGVSARYRELSQEVPISEGGRAHAAAIKKNVFVADLQEEPLFEDIAPLAGSEGFRSFADIPLLRGEQTVGLLTVQFTETHTFTANEINALNVLAEQAAIAIENARLYAETDEKLQRRVASLESLQRVTLKITSTLSLDQVLELVLTEVIRTGAADAGLVVLLHADESRELRISQGYDSAEQRLLRELVQDPFQDSIFREFLEQPKIRYVPDSAGFAQLQRFGSLLLAPVFYQDELAAVILIQSERLHAFTPAMLEFVEGLATQTSVAVGNARRYEEQIARGKLMHQRAKQMQLFLEVSHTMRSDRPLEEMLLDMAYAMQEAIGYEIVMISVLENDVVRRVAGAGIPLEEMERLKRARQSWADIFRLLQEQFRIGHCYYIPAEHQAMWRDEIDVFEAEDIDLSRRVNTSQWHPHDLLLIPLYSTQQKILGYVSVDSPRDRRAPTRALLEVVELFAAQIALAIENHQMITDLRLQVNTLNLFNEVSRAITAKLDLNTALNTVVQSVTNILGYDYSTIFLLNKESNRLMPRASSGYALEMMTDLTFSIDEGLFAELTLTNLPMYVENTHEDPRFEPGPLEIGSLVMAPLVVEGRSVGALTGDRKEKGKFSPAAVATFSLLADQVAVAVENARLFDEVKHFSVELEERVTKRTEELAEALENLRAERDRTDILYRIASELVANLDIDRVLNKALALMRDAVQADRGAILILDDNTGYLYHRASIGRDEAIPPGGIRSELDRDSGLIGWVLKHRKAVLVADVTTDERWITIADDRETRSVLAVPIITNEGRTIGAIFLHAYHVAAFTENDRRLVKAAAVQLGSAMNNANLYRMLREQAERLGLMFRTQRIEAMKNQAILEGIADGVMVTDDHGRVILFNEAAGYIFSVERTQALGRMLDEMLGLYGSRAREWMSQVQQWQTAPQSYTSGEFLADRLEIERKIVSVHLSPVISAAHEFLGAVSVFRDVTSEVEAERAKTEFVSTVSHELRTPMTAVKGYVDLLLMGATGDLTAQQKHFLKVIKGNADRLSSLVNDLLDISRLESGRIVLELAPLEMASLIEQVALTITPRANTKNIRVQTIVPAGLPKVCGDSDRINQILTNLVGNAYKYTPPGGIISIQAYVKDELFYLGVRDTGIGITREYQKKVFERFFRVDDPLVQEEAGTGLGLSITVSLIHLHGGDIFLESEPGEGSLFTFTLPLAEGESREPVGEPPTGFVTVDRPVVLVVEDDAEIAELLRLTLESEGHQVLLADSGEEALRIAREQHPDLISLDIRLPGLNGLEVLELLKRVPETAAIPVVIVSVINESKKQGLELGAVDYLTKPVDTGELLNVINTAISRQEGIVLVADDDHDTLVMMREALRAAGLNVRTTGHGDRAMQLARTIHPALFLLDLQLPGLNGYQILRQLRQDSHTADIPVIVMTGTNATESEVTETAAGTSVIRFLTKPFSVTKLVQEISQLVAAQSA
ncbi:MAG TPA: GAF domain-containing protein [Thermoflexia bacterium]|nr:GAF domain-containing protein [Thermoflexia bacterium]